MASLSDDLNKDIQATWGLIVITQEMLKPAAYFQSPPTQVERSFIKNKFQFNLISYTLWRAVIVELAKIFGPSSSQKFSVLKILGKMAPSGHYRSLGLPEEEWQKWSDRFAGAYIHYDEVNRLRNKFYAHSDKPEFENPETFLTNEDIRLLLKLALDFLNFLSVRYFHTTLLSPSIPWNKESFPYIYRLAVTEIEESKLLADENNMTYKELTGEDLPEGFD